MELLDYLKKLDPAEQEQFAVRVGTTINHLRNVAYKQRVASAALAAQIEIDTGGLVPVAVTRPKDWQLIWDPRRNQLVNHGAIVVQNDAHPAAAQVAGAPGAPPIPTTAPEEACDAA